MSGDGAKPSPADYIALGLLSAAVLAFEILLLRFFSLTQWHHFASLAVSVALLGFGAAGTALTLLGRRASRWDITGWGAMLTGLGILGVLALNQWLTVRPFFIIWNVRELSRLLVLDFAAFIPFFAAALVIGQAFARWPEAAPRLYAANMIGSGLGSLGAAGLLSLASVPQSIRIIALIAITAGVLGGFKKKPSFRLTLAGWVCALMLLVIAGWIIVRPAPDVRVSDFTRLAGLLDLPDANIVRRSHDLKGMATLVQSNSIRMASGLSLNWHELIPPSDALVLDTQRVIPLPRYGEFNEKDFAWLKASLWAAPWELRPGGSALILGTGNGFTPLQVRLHNARRIVWVEPDRRITDAFADRVPSLKLEIINQNPRAFISAAREQFDLIIVDYASSGGEAFAEDMLLTIQGLKRILARLSDSGFIVIPMALDHPPRHVPALFRMIRTVLERAGAKNPSSHVLAMRSLQEVIICVSRSPVAESQTKAWREFAAGHGFDLIWSPGMNPAEAGIHHDTGEPLYYHAAAALLAGERPLPPGAALYNLSPATDARPYFWHSVRWSKLPELIRALGRQGLAFIDWGALLLVVTLFVAGLLGVLLILLPLGRLPRTQKPFSRFRVFGFYSALGLGYLIFEMAVFQRCMAFFDSPVSAAAVIFSTFLIGSGFGSLSLRDQSTPRHYSRIFVVLFVTAALAFICLWAGAPLFWRLPKIISAICLVLIILPLAVALGRPMPWGLRGLASQHSLVPWAWGINGFASVIAPPLATLISVQAGQTWTWLGAALCYVAACWLARPWQFHVEVVRYPKTT